MCGGLWRGNNYHESKFLHLVISHCKTPLSWLEDFVKDHYIASIHIITKCGEDVLGAPSMATIEALPNVGRCDHTYAYYIANVLPNLVEDGTEADSVVVFLKDDISQSNIHQQGKLDTFDDMVRAASSDNGFACGILPDYVEVNQDQYDISAYHEVDTLREFSLKHYTRNKKHYSVDETEFASKYHNMADWWNALNLSLPNKLVQVCYGGVFAASVSNIFNQDIATWKLMEQSLSRGNNILEGHFAERTWAALLATPLKPFQVDALLQKADGVYANENAVHGALLAKVK